MTQVQINARILTLTNTIASCERSIERLASRLNAIEKGSIAREGEVAKAQSEIVAYAKAISWQRQEIRTLKHGGMAFTGWAGNQPIG